MEGRGHGQHASGGRRLQHCGCCSTVQFHLSTSPFPQVGRGSRSRPRRLPPTWERVLAAQTASRARGAGVDGPRPGALAGQAERRLDFVCERLRLRRLRHRVCGASKESCSALAGSTGTEQEGAGRWRAPAAAAAAVPAAVDKTGAAAAFRQAAKAPFANPPAAGRIGAPERDSIGVVVRAVSALHSNRHGIIKAGVTCLPGKLRGSLRVLAAKNARRVKGFLEALPVWLTSTRWRRSDVQSRRCSDNDLLLRRAASSAQRGGAAARRTIHLQTLPFPTLEDRFTINDVIQARGVGRVGCGSGSGGRAAQSSVKRKQGVEGTQRCCCGVAAARSMAKSARAVWQARQGAAGERAGRRRVAVRTRGGATAPPPPLPPQAWTALPS